MHDNHTDGNYGEPARENESGEPTYNEPTYGEPVYNEQTYSEPIYNESSYSEQTYNEPVYNAPVYIEQACNESTYNEPAYSEPVYNAPVYVEQTCNESTYNEPIYSEPTYNESTYSEPTYSEPTYNEVRNYETMHDMYTPGICVGFPNKPQRTDEYPPRKKKDGSNNNSFSLRAVCLVLACVLLSAATTYLVIEFRIQNGDFAPPEKEITLSQSEDVSEPLLELTPVTVPIINEISAEDIYEMLRTQVVGIRAESMGSGGFFGQRNQSAISGSGFIISSDGHILTNYHVIEASFISDRPITVYLEDDSIYEAEVIGFDVGNDVAVLKIEGEGFNHVSITDSENIRVGQRIYAIGNPFGTLTRTMTEGIVSALERTVTVDNKLINTFQISAAVNAGNSGGPVLNANGEVIGIVTAKFMSPEVEGVGFAIPINDAFEIASSLIEHGYITGRPFLGITPQTVTRGYAEFFGWVEGVYVRDVATGSAAEKAGILFGDIIIRLGDDDIPTREALEFIMRKFSAGDVTTITVWRNGEVVSLPLTFDEAQSAGQP